MSNITFRKTRICKKDVLKFIEFYLNPKNNCDISSSSMIQENFFKSSYSRMRKSGETALCECTY